MGKIATSLTVNLLCFILPDEEKEYDDLQPDMAEFSMSTAAEALRKELWDNLEQQFAKMQQMKRSLGEEETRFHRIFFLLQENEQELENLLISNAKLREEVKNNPEEKERREYYRRKLWINNVYDTCISAAGMPANTRDPLEQLQMIKIFLQIISDVKMKTDEEDS
ncbi:uncharacterized protein isoform X3 [Danio rerio]